MLQYVNLLQHTSLLFVFQRNSWIVPKKLMNCYWRCFISWLKDIFSPVIGCTIFPRYVMWTLIGGFSCQSREHVGHWLSGSSFVPERQRGLEKVKTSHSDCTAQNWEWKVSKTWHSCLFIKQNILVINCNKIISTWIRTQIIQCIFIIIC